MQIYGEDDNGNFIILYDSRWQYPELLGYEKGTREYEELRELWEERRPEHEKR